MSSRIFLTVIVVAVLSAVAAFLIGLQSEFARLLPPAFQQRSVNKAIVEVDWKSENGGHLHLKIPRGYVSTSFSVEKDNSISDLVIEAGLSDLRPRPAVTMTRANPGSAEWDIHQKFQKDGVWIHLSKGKASIPIAQVKANVRRRWQEELAKGQIYQLPSEHGLLHFQPMYCGPFGEGTKKPENDPAPGNCRSWNQERFISPDDGDDWMVASCTTPLLGPAGGCEITRSLDGFFQVVYLIRYSELVRWKEFDKGTRQLIDSFRIKD